LPAGDLATASVRHDIGSVALTLTVLPMRIAGADGVRAGRAGPGSCGPSPDSASAVSAGSIAFSTVEPRRRPASGAPAFSS
jgi:hypothetical protein